jgi:Sec7-like guanine-nucleotide exchange factor
MVERVYTRSASLDGEAVLVFMRALCAVCNEELDAGHPRLFSLHKLVDCAYHNIGRIRLVWSKLWGVISSHLVGPGSTALLSQSCC